MRVAIVTGASSGLGWFTAQELAKSRECDALWVVARRKERLLELQSKIPDLPVVPFPLDLRDPASYEVIQGELQKENPQITWLVNNAGFGLYGSFSKLAFKDQLDMIAVNITALTALTYIALPYMAPGSHLVQIASSAGFLPIPYFAVYAGTKSYVLSFSLSLAMELKEKGIVMTVVAPGPIPTGFQTVAGVQVGALERFLSIPPELAVREFLEDARKGKLLSIPGARMRWGVRALRLLPKLPLLPLIARISARRLADRS
jgi:short-subunit dehydrogenase